MAYSIRFLPDDRIARLTEPTELFLAALACEIWIEQPCGQKTICGKCRVRIVEGEVPPTDADRRVLGEADIADGWRLGCQVKLEAPATIEIPRIARNVAAKSFGDEHLVAPGFAPRWPDATGFFGVAADIGSTTVAAALVELATGRVRASVSTLNPQVRFGADVISRIHFAQEHQEGSRALHDAVLHALHVSLAELCRAADVSPDAIVEVLCAGNATMTHATVGEDVTSLGEAPFEGHFVESRMVATRETALALGADAPLRTLPMIRSHVGGDTVAAVLAENLDRASGWTLLVDLGTNSEVVLAGPGRLLACSTAAGPAFEGANIYQGMRAAPGAIDAVQILGDGRIAVHTIGQQPAEGLCGSGLVDACAEFVRTGIIAPSGYMRAPTECPDLLDALYLRMLTLDDGQRAVGLVRGVVLTAQDVRQLQLVKGSIRAGMTVLMQHAGITPDDLDEVLIAGAFGNFLRKTSALAIGLVPAVDPERVRFVGNAAGAGARLALVDRAAWERAERVSQTAEYVELAGHPDYEQAFCDAIPFPAPSPAGPS
ncbi:MAG: DUF4445 domain-containing protein [Vicinamibacteraceae bacterium]|nr:DUF4445 domain-containing protein [Vicinamibacteraceae bacterium]MCL4814597.1 DUF4445 domain-containing protein [Vicinamibacteraceae bacterium]